MSTVKPALKATCIKQSSVFKGHFFRSNKRPYKCKFTCIQQAPVLSNHFFAFPKVLA